MMQMQVWEVMPDDPDWLLICAPTRGQAKSFAAHEEECCFTEVRVRKGKGTVESDEARYLEPDEIEALGYEGEE